MADVFISYVRRNDRPKARALAELLEGFGFTVWWDDNLLPGETFGIAIAEVIRTSRAALVIWSPQSVKSHWVLDEAARARDEAKLIPLSLSNVQPPLGFGAIHTHNLDGWDGTHNSDVIEPILKSVERLVGRPRREFSKIALGVAIHNKNAGLQAASSFRWRNDFLLPFLYVVGFFLIISAAALAASLTRTDTEHYTLKELCKLVPLKELIKLVHIFAGMIILGGGYVLFLLFRIATRQERYACAEVARRIAFNVWGPTIILQPLIGLVMYVRNYGFIFEFSDASFRWLLLSLLLYAAASLSWITGFRSALEAALADIDYVELPLVNAIRFKRDVLLIVALFFTVGVYGLMVYRGVFFLKAVAE
jgi:uncharacterized membrane protein